MQVESKVYVAVDFHVREDGVMLPRRITWEDGRTYGINRVLHIHQASAAKAGGQGDWYTVMVKGPQRYIFFERSTNLTGNVIGRWFVVRSSC